METQRRAYSYAIGAILIWSTVASAFKISLEYLGSLQLLLYAAATSILILSAVLLWQRKLQLVNRCSRRDYLKSAILGFLNPFLYYFVLFKAYSLLPAQEAQSLNYTWPLILVLLSVPFLKQRITFRNVLAVLVSFFGAYIIATRGSITDVRFSDFTGVLLALASAVVWALYWVLNLTDEREESSKLLLNFGFGFIPILIANLLFSELRVPDARGLVGAIYIGLFEMGITFVIWLKALGLASTTARIGNFVYLVPFISLLVIHFVIGEEVLFSTLVGLFFIVSGIIIQQTS